MPHLPSSLTKTLARRLLAFVFCALAMLAAIDVAQAQSGRRMPVNPSPVPVPSPEPEPQAKPKPAKSAAPRISLIVAMNDRDAFTGIPLYIYQEVRDSFTGRLREPADISVTVAETAMFRGEAVKRAKAEKEAYVAWLELERDDMASQSSNPSGVLVHYVLFSPQTAKVKAEGRAYPQTYRRGGIGIPSTRTSGPLYVEYMLKQAAVEAAERILGELRHAPPPEEPKK